MPDRAITVSEDTWQALHARSASDETLDETITRLLDRTPNAADSDSIDDLDGAVEKVTFDIETDGDGY